MKKIIRLTESDLTRIVKKTIMELDRSTYERAADVAKERGFAKLSNKFREHGKEFGLNSETISMAIKVFNDDIVNKFRIVGLEVDPSYSKSYILKVENLYSNRNTKFMINKFSDEMEFYMDGNFKALPETRKDAKKILKIFKDHDFDVSGIDLRSISYEDTDL